MNGDEADVADVELIGWTCNSCGDTFTTHAGATPTCPSCGGSSTRPATEPFL